jgi:hypothetical protein
MLKVVMIKENQSGSDTVTCALSDGTTAVLNVKEKIVKDFLNKKKKEKD